MIRLWDVYDGRTIWVDPAAIACVEDYPTHHGAKSFLRFHEGYGNRMDG